MATIEELEPHRNWFRGDPNLPFTAVLDAYMADSLDLPTTVSKLVQPINEKYSSGDAGADDDKNPDTESLLWDLWYTILHSARKTKWQHPKPKPQEKDTTEALDPSLPSPGHEKLLTLLESLKTQPEPPTPSDDVVEKDDWIFRTDGKLWSVPLLLLGPAAREVLNDVPGAGSGYEEVELVAWENLNAFLAHVARREIVGLESMGVFALRHALEERHEDDVKGEFRASETRKLNAFVAAAGVWIVIMGEELWARKGGGKVEQQAGTGAGAAKDGISGERWQSWVERFRFLSCREDLKIDTRELAAQAAVIMMRVQT